MIRLDELRQGKDSSSDSLSVFVCSDELACIVRLDECSVCVYKFYIRRTYYTSFILVFSRVFKIISKNYSIWQKQVQVPRTFTSFVWIVRLVFILRRMIYQTDAS